MDLLLNRPASCLAVSFVFPLESSQHLPTSLLLLGNSSPNKSSQLFSLAPVFLVLLFIGGVVPVADGDDEDDEEDEEEDEKEEEGKFTLAA